MANVLSAVCGICGVIQVGGAVRQVVEQEVLDHMTDLMTHRGPNDRGTYRAPGVALGVRRLSIVDVAGGHQPFANEDQDVWAIQNGELYNHPDLRRELERDGHVLRSSCDTEILPHLYEREGERLAGRLRGKFGLAIWDSRRRKAVLARDPLGIKPLYYAQVDDVVVFASELKRPPGQRPDPTPPRLRGAGDVPHTRLLPRATFAPSRRFEASSGTSARGGPRRLLG